LIIGEQAVFDHMRALFPDWKARGLTACLHERQGGFAFNKLSLAGLAAKVEAAGVSILPGIEVTGVVRQNDRVTSVVTNAGHIEVDHVVVAVGPWIKHVWTMLDLPLAIDIRTPRGDCVRDRPMWTYWRLQEGEIHLDPSKYLG
jgi:glycine/D-amino acid oxidase-like deaminating enzyme